MDNGTIVSSYNLSEDSTTSTIITPVFETYQLILITILLTTVFLAGSLQNLAVIFAIFSSRNRLLDIPSTWFVLSLAAADLLFCAVSVPMYIVHLHTFLWEPFLVMGQIGTLLNAGSLFLLTFNRFLSIVDTFRYLHRMTLKRAQVMTFGMWSVTFILTFLSTIGNTFGYEKMLFPSFAYYGIINTFTGFFHLYMFKQAWGKIRLFKKQERSTTEEYRRQSMLLREFQYFFRLFFVVGSYTITWIPFMINLILTPENEERKSTEFQRRFSICYTLLSMNCMIDPLLYFLRSDEFKRFKRKVFPSKLPNEQTTKSEKKSAAFHIRLFSRNTNQIQPVTLSKNNAKNKPIV